MSTPSIYAPTTVLAATPITVVVGHAGVGKTNVALGLALALARAGEQVALADLDIVNPYFRSSDYVDLLDGHGIRLIAPVLARTTLDTPSLTGALDAAIEQAPLPGHRLVIDVGGDDDGATAIGRWSARLRAAGARVLYAVSAYRMLTTTPEEAAALVPGIEAHSHLQVQAVLNTSNLGDETTSEHVAHGRDFAAQVARELGLPLAATVVPQVAADAYAASLAAAEAPAQPGAEPLVALPRLIRTPWDL